MFTHKVHIFPRKKNHFLNIVIRQDAENYCDHFDD